MDFNALSKEAAVPLLAPGWGERPEVAAPAGLCQLGSQALQDRVPKPSPWLFSSLFPPLAPTRGRAAVLIESKGDQCLEPRFAAESEILRFPRWCSDKESTCQGRRHERGGFDPWVGKIPWRRKWQPTPAFLPGAFHGQRSLEGYSPRGFKRVGQDQYVHVCARAHTHTHTHTHWNPLT